MIVFVYFVVEKRLNNLLITLYKSGELQGTLFIYWSILYRKLVDQQTAHLTILNSGAKSTLTKAFVQLAPFLDQTNTLMK